MIVNKITVKNAMAHLYVNIIDFEHIVLNVMELQYANIKGLDNNVKNVAERIFVNIIFNEAFVNHAEGPLFAFIKNSVIGVHYAMVQMYVLSVKIFQMLAVDPRNMTDIVQHSSNALSQLIQDHLLYTNIPRKYEFEMPSTNDSRDLSTIMFFI